MKGKWIYKILFQVFSLILIFCYFAGNNSNYYLFICNSDYISEEDKHCIYKYSKTLNGNVKIIDSRGFNSATDLCKALKNSYSNLSNNIVGIQIFGTKNAVPAFDIGFEIDMKNGKIDTAYEDFVTDFFYSNFDEAVSKLKGKTSINDMFTYNFNLSFKPSWRVARLPLNKNEIAPFIKKYFDYKEQIKSIDKKIPIVSFSNPILLNPQVGIDDMGYFIKQKIDKECHYFDDESYKLYGLQEGFSKVKIAVSGGFSRENLERENQKGIMDLFINCHGEKDKFIKTIYDDNSLGSQHVSSFMDRSNVNSILKHNYYTLTAWSCLNAQGLDDQNIIYDMLRYKCIDSIAATSIISNNGTDNRASWAESKNNNLYCFYYEFFRSLASNYSRSNSFFNAQKVYADAVMNHENLDSFQYNILNLLSYHYLGLL